MNSPLHPDWLNSRSRESNDFHEPLSKTHLYFCANNFVADWMRFTKRKSYVEKGSGFRWKITKSAGDLPRQTESDVLGKQFTSRFLNQLTNSLAQNNIPSASIDVDQDSLDNNLVIEKASNRFRAGQWLVWSLAGINTMSSMRQTLPGDIPTYRSATAVALEFGVTDVWVNRAVWHARFSFQTSPTPEAVADQLVEELVAAKLLVQQSPQQNR